MNTFSIRARLLLLVLAMCVPLAAAIGYGIYNDMQQTISHTKTSLRTLANTMAGNTGGKIANARRMLERMAVRPVVRQVDRNNCDRILQDLHSLNPDYANVAYTDMDGLVVCSAVAQPGGEPVNVGEAPWFRKLLKEQRFTVGEPFFGPITGKWVSVLSEPIWNEHGQMVGAVEIPFDLRAFDPNIPAQFLPDGSRYGFLSDDGVLIWRNLDPEGLMGTRPKVEAVRQLLELRDGELEATGVDGVARYFSVVPMPETGWIAWVGVPASEVYAAAKQRAMLAAAVALGAITLLILLAIAITRGIAGPVAALERAARAVRGGNSGVRAAIAGPREIEAVATEFNAMVDAEQNSAAQLRSFLENSAVIAWLKDEDGRYIFVSDNFLARFARSRDGVMGRIDPELGPQPIAGEFRGDDPVLRSDDHAGEAVEAATNPDGSISWWLVSKFVFQSAEGQRMLGGLAVDITERKRTEANLTAAKQAAEAARLAQSRFLAAASHDLRQPIQALSLFNDALVRTGLSGEQERISDYLSRSIQALDDLLNALLDISKLDAGAVKPCPEIIQVKTLFKNIDADFSLMASERRLRFKLFFPSREMAIITDGRLLMSLLSNLIGNSIKYTRQGGILVGIRRRGNQALVQVLDTGIGIAPEHMSNIFEEYFQVGNPERDRAKGLGLGLAIAQRLAKLLGTEVLCRSRPGRGSVFEFRLPLADKTLQEAAGPGVQTKANVGAVSGLVGRRVVVVEDDMMVAKAIQLALKSAGMSVATYGNAEDALSDAEIADADFYICDFRLPGLDGSRLLDAIQQRSTQAIKAVLLTGDTSSDRIETTQSSPWTVLFKPVDLPTLLSVIELKDSMH